MTDDRGHRGRDGRLRACCAALALTVGLMTLHAGGYDRLSPEEQARSRGSSELRHVGTFRCDEVTFPSPCLQQGALCGVCTTASYDDTGSQTGGRHSKGLPNAGDCGQVQGGVCIAVLFSFVCFPDPELVTPTNCVRPNGDPTRQPDNEIDPPGLGP
jgi:hypothetical protein